MIRFTLVVLLVLAVAAAACGGDSDDESDRAPATAESNGTDTGVTLLAVDLNTLHGILDEDPAAQPFDRFPERIEIMVSALADLQPDVIFLQEVLPGASEDPEYVDVRAVLLNALPGYSATFGDITGAPIDEGSLGQMTLTKLPIVSAENHFVGGVRAVHRVTLETDAGPVDVFNVHLEGTEDDPQLAIDEIENVLAFIEESRTAGAPIMFAGDFNAQPGDPMIARVLEAGFVDALAAGGDATCEQAGDAGCTSDTVPLGDNAENLASRRIDYIFFRSGDDRTVEATNAGLFLNEPVEIGEGRLLWASDHIGVQALLEMN